MRKITLIMTMLVLLTALVGTAAIGQNSLNRPLYAPDLIKVKLSSDAISRANLPQGLYAEARSFGINELDQLMSINGGQKVIRAHVRAKDTDWEARTGFDRWFLIKLDGKMSVPEAIKSFRENRYIEEAIPEYYAYTTVSPNDTYYANNWGHNNTAQLPVYSGSSHSGAGVGTIGFDSDAPIAWDNTQGYGSASIIIAIIDTGVDLTHPDLRLVAGYDYGDNDSDPSDNSASPNHGTACSGVAAGIANNGLGVAGSGGGCSVMPLKIADSAGSLGFTAIENALIHTGDNNVDVASMSFGAEGGMAEGSSPSTDSALEYAYSHGVTLLAATANSNTSAMAYPSNHNKVISVGAASPTGQRKSDTSSDGEYWWGSNYGSTTQDAALSVDIMAPTILPATDRLGTNGYSTTDYYMWFNGTSCATPYAAGVAGLLKSKDPSLTPEQVRIAITANATDMTFDGGAGWDRYTGYGMINAAAALNSLIPGMPACQITAPVGGTIFDLNSTITVNVTATDTDGTITQVDFYIDAATTPNFTDYSSPYTWNWNTTGVSGGNHTIKVIATDNSSNTAQRTVNITLLAPPDEGFESGGFSAFAWINTSALPWTVQTADKYSGIYAAKSGAIDHSGSTSLSLPMNVSSAGNISFFQKISSESGYDYLRFYIDGAEQGSWSGAGSWSQQSYTVAAGARTFTWTYSKDGSVVSGSDCAFLDHIIFPPHGVFYAPPQNLTAVPSHQTVKLVWQAPASGTPLNYKVFRNSSLLTTVTGLSYTDTAVTNGTAYSYYVTAVHPGGESGESNVVSATPNTLAPTNLVATAGNALVNLSWTGVGGRALSGYNIYRGGSLLTTVVGTTYTDSNVVNQTTYSYYVTTVYVNPAGESAASNTATATPSNIIFVVLGTGTSVTSNNQLSPINNTFKSIHGQSVYTAAELTAAGIVGPMTITQLGFYPVTAPNLALANFVVRMKHTTSTNAATWQNATGMTTVYTNASYMPSIGGYDLLTLSTPFEWNGTDNLLLDTAFGVIANYTQTGTLQYTTLTSGYCRIGNDTTNQTDVFTGGAVRDFRPNLKLALQAVQNPPIINLPNACDFGINGNLVMDFASYVNDADLDPLTLGFSGNTNIQVDINGLEVTFSAVPDWFGEEELTFSVFDGTDYDYDTMTVTVNMNFLPPPPVEIVIETGTGTSVGWAPVPNATEYKIYRSFDPLGTFEYIGTTTSTTFEDWGLNEKAFYKVVAVYTPPDK